MADQKRAQARKLEQDAERWRQGARGERRVASVLAALPADYEVFHDLKLPSSKANVDHLVVAPHGVYVIDTKNFSYAVTRGRCRGASHLWSGRHRVRLDPLQLEASTTADLIGVDVTPMLCIIAPSLPAPAFEFDGVRVCSPGALLSNITKRNSRVVDVESVATNVTEVFGVQAEHRSPGTDRRTPERPSPPIPARRSTNRPMARPPTRGKKRRAAQHSILRPLLGLGALLLVPALLPAMMPLITATSEAVSERMARDFAPSPTTSASTAPSVLAPPPVVLDASCESPHGGWVITFGWPGDLPPIASAYSIRWEDDAGAMVRLDDGGWSHPAERLDDLYLQGGTGLLVATDLLDHEGRILASTPQHFMFGERC